MKEKHRYGQYFTEGVMADYMVSLIAHPAESRVLEPSCGEGVFLSKLSERGFSNVRAYEIDPGLARGFDNVTYGSFLSVPTDEKFDVVIGNPPYIRWRNLEAELKAELQGNALWNKYFNSLCDYLFIFILKSIEHLSDNGELILICSDYWMNSTHSVTLRNYMVSNGHFERIYHFKEAPLFEGVNASFVVFKYRKTARPSRAPIRLFTYTGKGRPSMESLQKEDCFQKEEIPQFRPNDRWLLAPQAMQEELRWLESVCVKGTNLFSREVCRIGDVCDIGNGMVSGLDAAFRLSAEEASRMTPQERRYSINVLKAKNLDRYRYTDCSRYIFVPQGMTEEELQRHCPHFAEHLAPYREALAERYSYGRELPYWEFAFPRSKALFERPGDKIFVPCKERISHKDYFRFCFAPEGFYPLQDVTAIAPRGGCRESVEYILAYLSSRYVYDWLRYNGIVKGEIVEFSETPVASIPFRRLDWNNALEVELHGRITSAVRQYVESGDKNCKEQADLLMRQLLNNEGDRLQETA